jgi:hypothetical protein
MKGINWCMTAMFFLVACKMQSGSDRNHTSPDKIFKLKLRPAAGSKFSYDVQNNTKTEMEVGDKTIENINKSEAEVIFSIDKDSSGNTLIGIQYQKLHIYTKKNDEETEINDANAATSSDPTEKFIGALKHANIVATVNSAGEVKNISGYREVVNEVLPELNIDDLNSKIMIQKQWQQMVEENLIRKNIDQLFKIFPDSAVHVGDQWKLVSHEKGDINFMVKHFFTLKSISDGIAHVESHGEIQSDTSSANLMGYNVSTDLKGEQNGEYEVDIKSGMMLNGKISSETNGNVQVIGRDVPLKIKVEIKINGKRI